MYCCYNLLQQGHSMSSGRISGNIPTSPSPMLMKFYQLLQLPFKLGSAKFQLQIINGWCTVITNVEVTFVAAGVFHDKWQSLKLFSAQTRQATSIKFGVPTKLGVLNTIIIFPLLKICPDCYYACRK